MAFAPSPDTGGLLCVAIPRPCPGNGTGWRSACGAALRPGAVYAERFISRMDDAVGTTGDAGAAILPEEGVVRDG